MIVYLVSSVGLNLTKTTGHIAHLPFLLGLGARNIFLIFPFVKAISRAVDFGAPKSTKISILRVFYALALVILTI
jgi:hypothetical protein